MPTQFSEAVLAILRDVPLALWEMRLPEVEFTYVSPGVERLFGHAPQSFLEDKDFWPSLIHPEDREQALASCHSHTARGEDHSFRFRMRHADGHDLLVQKTAVISHGPDGRPERMRGLFLDVSLEADERRARLLAEDVLDQVGSAATDVVWIRTPERMLYVSPAYETIWGRSCASLYEDPDSFLDLVHPEDRQRLSQAFQDCLRGVRPFDQEYRLQREDGEQRVIHGRARVELDEHGALLREVGLATDVTDRHREQQALRDAQRLESLGVLAGGVAHDFNNILVSVLGNADLARQELGQGHPAVPLLDDVLAAAHRAADLCRQMLGYAGRGSRVREPLEICREALEMQNLLRSALPTGAQLRIDPPDGSCWVEADRAQVSQVLLNLVTNAGEALLGGAGSVRVHLGRRDLLGAALQDTLFGDRLQPGPYVVLSVQDDGHGLAPEDLSRIFDPFVSTKGTGRGLGLSTVLGIARGHGGAVRVRSSAGRGTTFEVLFPAAEAPETDGSTVPCPSRRTQRPQTVLLLDDEPCVRALVTRVLEREGHVLVPATSLAEARDRLRELEPDVAILDLSLPDGDGRELVPELRRSRPDLPLVLTSGLADMDRLRAEHQDARCGVLPKPFVPGDLLRLLGDVLGPIG